MAFYHTSLYSARRDVVVGQAYNWVRTPKTENLLVFTIPAPSSGWNITRKILQYLPECIVGFLDQILRIEVKPDDLHSEFTRTFTRDDM
jgi:hypothetical protein